MPSTGKIIRRPPGLEAIDCVVMQPLVVACAVFIALSINEIRDLEHSFADGLREFPEGGGEWILM